LEVFVGIPAYNEEKNIASVILKLKTITDKIIVCDDGSSDSTGEIAEKLGASVIRHVKNLGYGAAIKSIFLKAKEMKADVLVTFDADGQHRIEDVEKLVKPIYEGRLDIVIGSRFLDKNNSQVPEYRKFGIKIITKVTNTSLQNELTDSQSGLRAYNSKVLSELTLSETGMGVSTEILIKASKNGLRIGEIPITILYEGETSSQHPITHGISVLMSTLKFMSIDHPLKFYGIPGVTFSMIGIFFMLWAIQEYTQFGNFPLVLSVIAIGAILLGFILLMNAVLLYSLVNLVRERNNK
jgi:glycosyltransferase involved in cell wall biosynthesis